MTGFAGVFALILAETVAGASVLTWGSPLWNETKRSFFSIWSVIMVLLFAWPTWLAARSAAIAGDADAARAVRSRWRRPSCSASRRSCCSLVRRLPGVWPRS